MGLGRAVAGLTRAWTELRTPGAKWLATAAGVCSQLLVVHALHGTEEKVATVIVLVATVAGVHFPPPRGQ